MNYQKPQGEMKTAHKGIHKGIVIQVVASLVEIFTDETKYADKVIERVLKNQKKWGSRDRRFFAENVYDCVRWWRRLQVGLGNDQDITTESVFLLWAIYFSRLSSEGRESLALPSWPELSSLPSEEIILGRWQKMSRAERESIPDWMDHLGEEQLGQRWDKILESLNKKSSLDIRTNTLKTDKKKLKSLLREEGVETTEIPGSEVGLFLNERKNVFITKAFSSGLFEMQDRASQKVAEILAPLPGERVIDACAGAGGKTLHLAALMKNQGKIIAMDTSERKLEELKKRARRGQISCIETRPIDSSKVIKRLDASADRLLLDVPCSGLGVLRRNPDSKWKLSAEKISALEKTQSEILRQYSRMVKPGGKMVYATCSILPSENEKQVEKFLSIAPEWLLESSYRNDPDQGSGDGFFAALFRRKT